MTSLGEVEDHIYSEMLMKKGLIADYIQTVIDELSLVCPVTALNNMLLTLGLRRQITRGGMAV